MEDFDFLSDTIDLDFDFDMGDFDLMTEKKTVEPQHQRILKPRVDKDLLDTRMVSYDNARAFVQDLNLSENKRTYAWLDGTFIYGEIPEALGESGHPVRRAWITSLGMSEENADSFYNCFYLYGLEKLSLLLSAYFYSHEKYGIIPYIYNKLDLEIETEPDKWEPCFQVGYFNMHAKIMCLELYDGTKLTIHGSSNLRSSSSIEQIMVETDPELFDFNVGMIREFMKKFFTINHDYGEGRKIKPLRNNVTAKIIKKIRR